MMGSGAVDGPQGTIGQEYLYDRDTFMGAVKDPPTRDPGDSRRVIDDLGLDDFLQKLRTVTGRAQNLSSGTGSKDHDNSNTDTSDTKSEVSRLNAEIDELKSRLSPLQSLAPPPPARAQRMAPPPPAPARSPRSSPFEEPSTQDSAQTVPQVQPVHVMQPDADAESAQNALTMKIARMQEALQQSREMRAALLGNDADGISTNTLRPKTSNPNMRRPNRAPPPFESAPMPVTQQMNEPMAQSTNAKKAPQLLQRNTNVPYPSADQQKTPTAKIYGQELVSEQELLSQVSQFYQGDPALQHVLWDMVADGLIRTTHELQAHADKMRREAAPNRNVHAGPSQLPPQPRQNEGWPRPGAQGQSNSMDYGVPARSNNVRPQQQPRSPMPTLINSQQPHLMQHQPAPHMAQHQPIPHPTHLSYGGFGGVGPRGTQGQQIPPYPHGDIQQGRTNVQQGGQQIPPYPHGKIQQGQAKMQQGQDFDILSRSFNEINRLATTPPQQYGVAPRHPNQIPALSGQRNQYPGQMKQIQKMNMPAQQKAPQIAPLQTHYGLPNQSTHQQEMARVLPQPHADSATPVIPVAALSSEEKSNLIGEGYDHGEML